MHLEEFNMSTVLVKEMSNCEFLPLRIVGASSPYSDNLEI